MRIYLDVCCLNRPFDDHVQGRVAIEAAAIETLLEMIDSEQLADYSSQMAQVEIGRITDPDRRRRVTSLLPPDERIMPLSDDLLDEADELVRSGFGLADAVHLTAARLWKADIFVTVDDKLIKRASRLADRFGVRVVNPVVLAEELGHVDR